MLAKTADILVVAADGSGTFVEAAVQTAGNKDAQVLVLDGGNQLLEFCGILGNLCRGVDVLNILSGGKRHRACKQCL